MSLLTPVKLPVKVYRWDDAGAPALDKTAGCLMAIFKACLVTGYGAKESAGWSMPFDNGVDNKVFRPPLGAGTNYYLRLGYDTGTEVKAYIYSNMTSATAGDFVMWPSQAFKYAKGSTSLKWLLVASPRGFVFFCGQNYKGLSTKTGAFFVVGDVSNSSGSGDGVYLNHTCGTGIDGDYASINGIRDGLFVGNNPTYYTKPLLWLSNNTVIEIKNQDKGLFDGVRKDTENLHTVQMMIFADKSIYLVPGLFFPSNGAARENLETLTINQSQYGAAQSATVHGTASNGESNLYICTDYWVY